MLQDPHYTGDETKLHTGQHTGDGWAHIDSTPTLKRGT